MEGQRLSESIVSQHLERIWTEYCSHHKKWMDMPYSVCKVVPLEETVLTDIGGDMNHVHRVHLQCGKVTGSVIVKRAPKEVKFLKEICGEEVTVDTRRVEYEAAALQEVYRIQPLMVPKVFLLDADCKSIVMEDLTGYRKLEEKLTAGELEVAAPILQRAMSVLGELHKATWLNECSPVRKDTLLTKFNNAHMKNLMCQLLFDRPFDPLDKSNRCNPLVLKEVEECRSNQAVQERVKWLKTCFMEQLDCLCHGDFSCDNILVKGEEIKVVDMEFAGIGLRAYDVSLLLETIVFHLFTLAQKGEMDGAKTLHTAVHCALDSYTGSAGRAPDSVFVQQVCGLIGCEQMWRVFGSYEIEEFDGQPQPELALLSLARAFLLRSEGTKSVVSNIDRILLEQGVCSVN